MKKLRCLSFLALISSLLPLKAQTHVIDSLRHALATERDDTAKVKTLNSLSKLLSQTSNNDSSISCANRALTLATQIGFENGRGYAFLNLDICYYNKSNYSQALFDAEQGLVVFQKTGNNKGIADSYTLIGNVYGIEGNYPKSLEYFFKALDINDKYGNKTGSAAALGNIGNVYDFQKNYSKALQYDLKALSLDKQTGNKQSEAIDLSNIGGIYDYLEKRDTALKYYFNALDMVQRIGDKTTEVANLENIGQVYSDLGKYDTALSFEFKALALIEQAKIINYQCYAFEDLGGIYLKQKKYTLSKIYLDSALLVTKKIGEKVSIKDIYNDLVALDSAQGDYKAELRDNKFFNLYRDSLNTEQIVKEEMNYEAQKRMDSIKAEQDKRDAIVAKDEQRQKVIRNSLTVGFFIVFAAAGIFFIQRRRIAKEKQRSDDLLLNILPSETAEELKETGETKAKKFDSVTVMFSDFKDFTKISEKLSSDELVSELHFLFQHFDNIMQKHHLEKIKTIGDSYMAAGGLPVPNETHAKDVINAAKEIQQFLSDYNNSNLTGFKNLSGLTQTKPKFEARIGINTGPVVAGIVGIKKFAYDIWGDTVNIASRMESASEAGKINISGSTYELVKNDFKCAYRGKIEAKNKGEVDMYFVD